MTRRVSISLLFVVALLASACSDSASTDTAGLLDTDEAAEVIDAEEPTADPTVAPDPTEVPEPTPEPLVVEYSANVTAFDYENCADGADMVFYEIEGAGHTWPGSAISLAVSEAVGLGVTTAELSASETSWAFFEQYSLAG